jgi:hypothetical protein
MDSAGGSKQDTIKDSAYHGGQVDEKSAWENNR